MAGAFKADKLRHVLQFLPEDIPIALGHDRDVAHTQCQQPLAATRVVQNVNDFVINLLFRKKLFRSEAGASPRLQE